MQIPLIKISMEVLREWKSSKLGIETGLRNRILIHQTCQEWSNPGAIQRQLRTMYMIPDNPLYCISPRISSPFCSWLHEAPFGAAGFLLAKKKKKKTPKNKNRSNFVMLNLLMRTQCWALGRHTSSNVVELVLTRNVNDWNRPLRRVPKMNLFDIYLICCSVAEILYPSQWPRWCYEKRWSHWIHVKGLHEKAGITVLHWGWNFIFNLIIILHQHHKSFFQTTIWWVFLFKTPPKTET